MGSPGVGGGGGGGGANGIDWVNVPNAVWILPDILLLLLLASCLFFRHTTYSTN